MGFLLRIKQFLGEESMELGDSGVSTTLLRWHCCLLILILHFVFLCIFYIWIACVSLLDKLNAYYQMAHAMHNMIAHLDGEFCLLCHVWILGRRKEREICLSCLGEEAIMKLVLSSIPLFSYSLGI